MNKSTKSVTGEGNAPREDDTCPKCGSSACAHVWELDAKDQDLGSMEQAYETMAQHAEDYKAQRDELLAALKNINDLRTKPWVDQVVLHDVYEIAQAAIARAEGSAQ